jgi:hypothetical protein
MELTNSFCLKKSSILLASTYIVVGFFAFLYTFFFSDFLFNGDVDNVLYSGIVQSDTLNYRNIYLQGSLGQYLDAHVKNILLPVLLWEIFAGNWYLSILLNLFFLYSTNVYLKKISTLLNININVKYLIFIVFLPETFIYLIGSLKELPSLFFITLSTYYFLKKKWILYILSIIILIVIRYQFIFSILIFLISYIIFNRKSFKFLIYFYLFIGVTYPFWIGIIPGLGLEDALLYRSMEPGIGLGAFVEYIQFNIYFISAISTVIKFFQMIMAPWPNVNIFPDGYLDIINLIYACTAVICIPMWYKYLCFLCRAFRNSEKIDSNILAILSISISTLMLPALNAFVHHRYLYPGLSLVVLFWSIQSSKLLADKNT